MRQFHLIQSISILFISQALKPKVPVYEALNFQIKGYDFSILEKYQSFLHRTAEKMSLDVEDR